MGTNPALNLTTTFTPDAVGNVYPRPPAPLGYVSNATFVSLTGARFWTSTPTLEPG